MKTKCPHRKQGFETRFGEVILGLIALSYGWHAIHFGSGEAVKSQFQILLVAQGTSFEWGAALCFAGIASAVFALSRFSKIRLLVHIALFLIWTGVMVLFLGYREPGLPLTNGMILSLSSIAVICTILFHEKHSSDFV